MICSRKRSNPTTYGILLDMANYYDSNGNIYLLGILEWVMYICYYKINKWSPDVFVVSPCFDLTLNLREFAFPSGVNA